jgi:hypothetical protein
MPVAGSTTEYQPQVTFGLTPAQLAAFFNDPVKNPTGNKTIDGSTAYNRDFSFDAIVNLHFALGSESTDVIKRVVYWPRLPAEVLPADLGACTVPQVANRNPVIKTIGLFRQRIEGQATDPYMDPVPVLSRSSDTLYVEPTYDPASVENYLLRVSRPDLGQIVTECRHELLTFRFFTSFGTFSPPERASELLPLLTSPDGKVHLDSQWKPPASEDIPGDGKVTFWIVVQDERAGSSWMSRTISLTP